MGKSDVSSTVTRRRILLAIGGGGAVAALLAACGGAATPTVAPTKPAAAAPTAAPKPAEPTKPAAAAPTTAPAAKPAEPTKPAAAAPTTAPAAKPTSAPAAAAPAMDPKSVKLNGTFNVLQERGFNPNQTKYITDLVEKKAKEFGWTADISTKEGFTGGTNFIEKFTASVRAGQGPDLYLPGTDSVLLLWNNKTLRPVDDMAAYAEGQFGKAARVFQVSNKIEGKWWAVPMFMASGGWWARKSWFDKVNFDITKLYDLQQWLEACVQVSNPDAKQWGWGNTVNRSGDGNTNVGVPFYSAGGRLTTADNKPAFNSEQAVMAFEWLKDVYTNPKWAKALPTGVNAWNDTGNNEAYLAGTIGFSSNGGTMFATAVANKPDVAKDTFMVPWPTASVGKKEDLPGGAGTFQFFLPEGSKNPDAGRVMIQELLKKEAQKEVWKNSPSHSLPAYEWGWDEPEANTGPNEVAKVFRKQALSPNYFMDFMPGPEPKLWISAVGQEVVLTDTMAEVLKGTPAKDAVKNGHDRVVKIWEKFQGK
ncbi:MAG: hypothetical protein IT340_10575 [Chloroflexi bacterium]|nr:hypothetical protein [Chloroflexota bacterium]